ncbi:uncharacterized protein LOC6586317 [Drosophila mojavensis]|uniref:Uncharacterized protein n=1 Tax=Drosophila mojavensis TaxID=7230 RepID=B4L8S9_DROMO|nr:uncharacterized protein LOC6586317 [Drosophila mojavensis]EDW08054.1 uncharacterized protein Dmoj_GI14299 [Drosophila mojavensis]
MFNRSLMNSITESNGIPALLLTVLVLSLTPLVSGFGNEYVHIKVHVPKDQVPSIGVDVEQPPKVIHHFHHHAPPHIRSRGRPHLKTKTSPLLESVILSDLDKPLHMSEHADYLNHAKELAEHLSDAYAAKKPPPKKKVNTYTIIEEKHRPSSYEYESRPDHAVDTYHVIDSRPQQHHTLHHHKHSHQLDDNDDDVGYHYASPARQHLHKPTSSLLYHGGGYAEPAPVEEPLDLEQGYSYSPPSFAHAKTARAPTHTLEVPQESSLDSTYPYDSRSTSSFRPSPQLPAQPNAYEDDIGSYVPPIQSRRRRPSPVDWPSRTGYKNINSETYSGADSYNVGHVQGVGSSGYQYPGPYL